MHANRNSLPTAAPVTTAALGYINMLPAGLLVVFIYGCTTAVAMSIDEIGVHALVRRTFITNCCGCFEWHVDVFLYFLCSFLIILMKEILFVSWVASLFLAVLCVFLFLCFALSHLLRGGMAAVLLPLSTKYERGAIAFLFGVWDFISRRCVSIVQHLLRFVCLPLVSELVLFS